MNRNHNDLLIYLLRMKQKKQEMTIISEIFAEYFSLARLAQSVERETLNLNVVGSSPTLGVCFSNNFC